jgi:hypothetical protein
MVTTMTEGTDVLERLQDGLQAAEDDLASCQETTSLPGT